MVDPNNRLVADSLEADWNEKLRALADAREQYDRYRGGNDGGLDEASLARLSSLATDFKRLWSDPQTPARERKRMLAHIVEDVTLMKLPSEGITRIHVRFKGGRTETLTAANPKSSAQMVKTSPEVVAAIDELLDEHIYEEIAEILNARGLCPGGCARPGRADQRFCATRVQYVVHTYHLRSRYERLRERGMLTLKEIAKRLSVSPDTVVRWASYRLLARHAYNGKNFLYEDPGANAPKGQPSRWNTLAKRAAQRRQEAPQP